MASTFRLCNSLLHKRNVALMNSLRTSMAASSVVPPAMPRDGECFDAKNKRLARPMSPHLTIYKPQLTSMLSITHRGTGLLLSGVISGFSIGMMALPSHYPYYLNMVAQMQMGPAIIFAAKFAIVFPFMFHTFNGIRHLIWDMGYGFSLRALYQSGYSVLALAVVAASIVCYL